MALTIYFLLSSYIYINIFMSSLLPLTVINYHYTFPCVRAAPQYLCWRRGLSAHWGERLRRKLSPVIRHLSSYHHPTPALTLLSNCSHTTLTMLSHYSHNALTLLSFYCSHTSHHTDLTSPGTAPHILLILLSQHSFSNCSHTPLTLLSHCSHTALLTVLTTPCTDTHILLILLLSLLICPSFHSLSYLQNFIILFDWTNGRPTQLMGNFVEIEIKRIPCLYVHTVRV